MESGRLLEQGRELQKTARSLLISRPRWSVSRRFIVDSFQTLTAGSLIPKGRPIHVLSEFVDMRKRRLPARGETRLLNARWKKTEKENKNLEVGKVDNNTRSRKERSARKDDRINSCTHHAIPSAERDEYR
jgi:hypothetical protein